MLKRSFDVLIAAGSLTVLAIPMALITLAVKLTSSGPIVYRQQRIGRGGRPFWLYKFRTMRVGEGGSQVTAAGDPRITSVGRFLRRCKLDELPQLWNILRGDMSLVGPRPEVERFVKYYTPEQRRVLEQTPGLAGMATLVYPHEADLLRDYDDPEPIYVRHLMPKKIAVDLEYGRCRTFWSDLQLLAEIAMLAILGKSRRCDYSLQLPTSAPKTWASPSFQSETERSTP